MQDDYDLETIANGQTNTKTALTILAVHQREQDKKIDTIPDMQTTLSVLDSRLKMIERVAYGLIGAVGLALVAGLMKVLLK